MEKIDKQKVLDVIIKHRYIKQPIAGIINDINALPTDSEWVSATEKELRNVLVKIKRGDTLLSIYQTIEALLPTK